MCKNEWHDTRTCQHEPSTFLKRETTGSLSSEYSVANVDDSTRFDLNRTTRHSKWRSVIPDVNLQKKTIFSKCLENRHPVWRVVICCVESFDSTTFSTPCGIFFKCLLQMDFWYAFPCHKRWFLRPPVSQHHLAANRLPVWRFVNCLWRFAAVWVYWTTLRNTNYIPNS